MRAEKRITWLMSELADSTASVYLVPDIFMFELLHARSDVIAGIPTISIYDSPLDGSNAIVKRIEDLVLSSIILLLITPILIAISIAVKVTSSGPVLFKQLRYGIDGKPIKVWKFRSMTVMENGAEVTQAKKNDVRLTPIGRFIRSTSLDELPQFINVLQGRMSIVGPRPHAVAHNEAYRTIINGYMLRHKVKPGITGWAQVNGWRGETDTLDKMEKRIEFDLDYIRNWSLGFDLKIVISTVFKGFIDKSAY
jgi:putative colanic acid biosynthesis UDP-glucose lipid carrier transferase